MTKQEQIKEMAVIGCVRNPQAHTAEECAKCDFKQGQCNAYRHAEKLYNAGYRKAEEVRKETAEKIFGDLWNNFVEYSSYAMDYTQHLGEYDKNINITVSDVICDIICIAKNYGVDLEVEE